jgi:NADH-quinone oxidoreductase subunit N
VGNGLALLVSPAYGALLLGAFSAGSALTGRESLLVQQAALLGTLFVLCAASPFALYLGVELQSYALYTLTALGAGAGASRTGGVLYFIAGSLASVLILGGYTALNTPGATEAGALAMALGFLVKVGSFPLGGWAALVYRGLRPETGAVVMTYPKVALVAAVGSVGLLGGAFGPAVVAGALSVLVGSLLGLAGEGFMAVLAFSSMAHAGYALLALAGGSAADGLFYAVQYAGSTAAFLLLLQSGFAGTPLGRPVLRSLVGLAGRGLAGPRALLPLYAFLLSFGGIPPFVGFYAKVGALVGLYTGGAVALLPVVIFSAAMGMAFYLWMLTRVGFGPGAPLQGAVLAGPQLQSVPQVLSASAVALALVLSVFWGHAAQAVLLLA